MSLISPDQVTQIASNIGFPPQLANGIINQESGYGAASPNVGQITSSTAAQPGYGMPPISQADIMDPVKNATWSLSLAKAKAQAAGIDPNDPANFAAVLHFYNGVGKGAGDPSYVQHVFDKMGMTPPAGAGPSDPTQGPFTGQPLPPMPAGFGQPQGGPTQAPQVDLSRYQGNPLIAGGLALAGGNGWHDGLAKAGAAYTDASAQLAGEQFKNAELQSQTNELNQNAPLRAAQAADARADAWRAMNPQVTPDEAAKLNLEARGQDYTHQQAMAELAQTAQLRTMMFGGQKGAPQQLVVPGADGSIQRSIVQIDSPSGVTYEDPQTGQRASTLHELGADNAIPAASYNAGEQRELAVTKPNDTEADKLLDTGSSAMAQKQQLQSVFNIASQPGANTGPGFIKSFGRAFDQFTGTSTFGNLSDEQAAQLSVGQGNWGSIKSSIPAGSRLTNNDVNLLTKVFPSMGTDPAARTVAQSVLNNALDRQSALASSYANMPDVMKQALRRSPSGVRGWEIQQQQAWDTAHPIGANGQVMADPSDTPPPVPGATASPVSVAPPQGAPPANRPSLHSIFN